jgi:5-methylcytosine-specific restriction endonuclease McrA
VNRRTELRRTPLARKPGQGLKRTPLRPVSKRRVRENALRRRVVLETFGRNPTCERCGVRPADDVHERVLRSAGGSIVDPANLVALCRPCHTAVHHSPTQARAEGWIL